MEATARVRAIAMSDVLQTVYEQAIGAQLRVNDLEDQAGLTLAVFAPLPPVSEAFQITVLDVNSENIKGSLNGL
ncbi:hypothetical protein [Gluconobacter japonicus]|uniref:hypothetical protein n=1 Tax=Gluconobacter japonicus TaxID=376620 RepID=UPI001B8D4B81|nr:hypothetical protein [Gluconobacter japonicus]MBS1051578.1 hypothetical protein [Gluconobacter japonicus]